jgi:amino acid transporter
MAHNGLAHGSFRATHALNQTPGRAVVITGVAAVLPAAVLAGRGASGLDVYGWLGSLATYGFIVAYALVCVALPKYLRDHGVYRLRARIIPGLAGTAMLLALVGNLYSLPEGLLSCPTFTHVSGTIVVLASWTKQDAGRLELPGVKPGNFPPLKNTCGDKNI